MKAQEANLGGERSGARMGGGIGWMCYLRTPWQKKSYVFMLLRLALGESTVVCVDVHLPTSAQGCY